MLFGDYDLNLFEVDCDGSACGSHTGTRHVHLAQYGGEPYGRVAIRNREILWDSLVPAGQEVSA